MRGLALLIAAGCRGTPTPVGETDPATPEDTDLPFDPGFWDDHISGSPLFGADLTVLTTDPFVVAVVTGASYSFDLYNPTHGHVLEVVLAENRVTVLSPLADVSPDQQAGLLVEFGGDLTGDGHDDLIVSSDPHHVVPGPDFAFEERISLPDLSSPDVVAAVRCDAANDGIADLCSSRGVDLGPVDGVADTTWDPGAGMLPWGLVPGKSDGSPVLFLAQDVLDTELGISSLAVPVGGVASLGGHTTWLAGDSGRQLSSRIDRLSWAPIALGGDDTDSLLVCHDDGGGWGLRLLDPFPQDAPVSFAVPGPCDALEVADFDGDGDPEIAVGTESRLLILDPSTWTVLAEHVGTLNPLEDDLGYALDSADLNGDGRMDLVVGAPRVGRVYILTRVIP